MFSRLKNSTVLRAAARVFHKTQTQHLGFPVVAAKWNQNHIRTFSTYFENEYKNKPWKNEYMVTVEEGDEQDEEEENVPIYQDKWKIPHVDDHQMHEMYAMHMYDPHHWTLEKIAERYECSLDRTKAIIVLMDKRFTKMAELGREVIVHPPPTLAEWAKMNRTEIDELWDIDPDELQKNEAEIDEEFDQFDDEDYEEAEEQEGLGWFESLEKKLERIDADDELTELEKDAWKAEVEDLYCNPLPYVSFDFPVLYQNLFDFYKSNEELYSKNFEQFLEDYNKAQTPEKLKEEFVSLFEGEEGEEDEEETEARELANEDPEYDHDDEDAEFVMPKGPSMSEFLAAAVVENAADPFLEEMNVIEDEIKRLRKLGKETSHLEEILEEMQNVMDTDMPLEWQMKISAEIDRMQKAGVNEADIAKAVEQMEKEYQRTTGQKGDDQRTTGKKNQLSAEEKQWISDDSALKAALQAEAERMTESFIQAQLAQGIKMTTEEIAEFKDQMKKVAGGGDSDWDLSTEEAQQQDEEEEQDPVMRGLAAYNLLEEKGEVAAAVPGQTATPAEAPAAAKPVEAPSAAKPVEGMDDLVEAMKKLAKDQADQKKADQNKPKGEGAADDEDSDEEDDEKDGLIFKKTVDPAVVDNLAASFASQLTFRGTPEEAKKIIENMLDDNRRWRNTIDSHAEMYGENLIMDDANLDIPDAEAWSAEENEEEGGGILESLMNANVSGKHQETASIKVQNSIKDKYFPQLLNDNNYEREKKRLLDRVEAETRGFKDRSVDYYQSRYEDKSTTPKDLKEKNATYKAGQAFEKPSRWKIAFKDRSKNVGVRKGQEATTIVTRTGGFRKATPLEELTLQHSELPGEVDLYYTKMMSHLNEKVYKKNTDVDKEDYLTKKLLDDYKARRLAMKEEKEKAKAAAKK